MRIHFYIGVLRIYKLRSARVVVVENAPLLELPLFENAYLSFISTKYHVVISNIERLILGLLKQIFIHRIIVIIHHS